VRLIRLGTEPSEVSADVRAALSTWGAGDAVLGGVALLGVQPPDCPHPLDAVLVLPRGVLVVVGVDLPDPAMRLEAPLTGQWKIDGWPLVRPDGATSPAAEALKAASAVAQRIQAMRAEPLPVSTVVAVGPFVNQVVQPTVDLNRGVRVLHPKPTTLLAAARELATSDLPCSVDHAAKLIAVLAPTGTPPGTAELHAEGFADAVTTDLATASTMLLPKVSAFGLPTAVHPPVKRPERWLAGAAAVVGLAVIAVVFASTTSGGESTATTSSSTPPMPMTVVVDGANFSQKGTAEDSDCAAHAFGDVHGWLAVHPCRVLRRAQYETTVDGRRAAIAVAELGLPDGPSAQEIHGVVAAVGSGGVTPLVKEGKTWQGGPRSFDRAAFASTVKGSQVRIAQAVWAEGESTTSDPALKALAEKGLRLPATR
jgi:hypothetical protein